MNGKNIELLVENDRSWKFEWIFKQAITCGKCDGLLGNVSVLQQFYKLIFDFEKL